MTVKLSTHGHHFNPLTLRPALLPEGSGIRLTIFDAMAMGKVVISTPIGAEGIVLEPHGAGILALDSSAYSKQTLSPLTDRDGARQLVCKVMPWLRESSPCGSSVRGWQNLQQV